MEAAGFKSVVLTIDAIAQYWLPYGNFHDRQCYNAFKTDLSWADLEFSATTSGLPVVVKGITWRRTPFQP